MTAPLPTHPLPLGARVHPRDARPHHHSTGPIPTSWAVPLPPGVRMTCAWAFVCALGFALGLMGICWLALLLDVPGWFR